MYGNGSGPLLFLKKLKKGLSWYPSCHTGFSPASVRLVLLAENETGWFNLMRLVSTAHLYGEYYKPRIDRPLFAQYHEGRIARAA